eukprot:5754764-Prymnesium_polylepis.1
MSDHSRTCMCAIVRTRSTPLGPGGHTCGAVCATEKSHTACGHVFTRHAESDRSQRRACKVERRQSSSYRVPAGVAQSNCGAGQPTRVRRAAQPEGARPS